MKTKGQLAFAAIMALTAIGIMPREADATGNVYLQENLVTNAAPPNKGLKNPWGIAFAPNSPFWINENGSGLAVLYDGTGTKVPLEVKVPGPTGSPADFVSSPTGMVWNGTQDFKIPSTTLPAIFIFATEDGTISGWNPNDNPQNAILIVDNSKGGTGAVYKGLAFATNGKGNFIYATNFRSGKIDVFDSKFQPAKAEGPFEDPKIPAGYAPFGIANINGDLFVTYAQQNAQKHDDVAGPGKGFVDVYDADGNLLRRFASHGALNSPWGVTRAAYGFGLVGGDILVGNFGDGKISAFESNDGEFLGQLAGPNGKPIVIDGLWALSFGGALKSEPDALYFTAGPNNETDGIFGRLQPSGGTDIMH